MIRLTLLDDQPLYVLPNSIEWLTTDCRGSGEGAKSAICTSSGVRFFVKETADEVIKAIREGERR